VVLVGGLVPPFLVPDLGPGIEPHIGTSDIDLAIGVFAPEEEAYVTLVRAIKDCGFAQRQGEPSFRWFGDQDGIEIILEILCPESEEFQNRIRRRVEADGGSGLSAFQVRGVELAATDFVPVTLDEDVAELGDRGPIELRVVAPTTLIALKAQALADVDKPKHAYDIVWLCDAWPHPEEDPNGVGALAQTVLSSAVSKEAFIIESFRLLTDLFSSPMSPGPVGYAGTIGGDTADSERARLYAHGLVQEFLKAVGQT
jgi:hypothetical protein